jgi:hypothetical protein
LNSMLDHHGGAVPLTSVDRVIVSLPGSWLSTPQKDAVSGFLRPLARKLLLSATDQAIDSRALGTLYSAMDDWNRGQTHLETLYSDYSLDPKGVSSREFLDAADQYISRLDPIGAQDVRRIKVLNQRYLPLFAGDDAEITFGTWKRYSLSHMSKIHAVRLAVEHLIRSYSKDPVRATLANLTELVTDITGLGVAFHVVDPTIPDLPKRRFTEANYFTFSSNGDSYLDLDEAVYYINYYLSLAHVADRTVAIAGPLCATDKIDAYNVHWMDGKCFRKVYFDNHRVLWDHAPGMINYYEGLPAKDRAALEVSMEAGARRFGKNDLPVGRYDSESLAAVIHFIETIFKRFDLNDDQELDKTETLNAYPVFKMALAEVGKIDPKNNNTLEAAFTYTVHHGRAPKTDFWGTADFIVWMAGRAFWDLHAGRANIYSIISLFAVPETPPANP